MRPARRCLSPRSTCSSTASCVACACDGVGDSAAAVTRPASHTHTLSAQRHPPALKLRDRLWRLRPGLRALGDVRARAGHFGLWPWCSQHQDAARGGRAGACVRRGGRAQLARGCGVPPLLACPSYPPPVAESGNPAFTSPGGFGGGRFARLLDLCAVCMAVPDGRAQVSLLVICQRLLRWCKKNQRIGLFERASAVLSHVRAAAATGGGDSGVYARAAHSHRALPHQLDVAKIMGTLKEKNYHAPLTVLAVSGVWGAHRLFCLTHFTRPLPPFSARSLLPTTSAQPRWAPCRALLCLTRQGSCPPPLCARACPRCAACGGTPCLACLWRHTPRATWGRACPAVTLAR